MEINKLEGIKESFYGQIITAEKFEIDLIDQSKETALKNPWGIGEFCDTLNLQLKQNELLGLLVLSSDLLASNGIEFQITEKNISIWRASGV